MKDMVAEINTKGLDNWTALHYAANQGNTQILDELLNQPSIDKSALSALNRTPLHLSACHGHVEICRKLVTAGTEKNA
jgi:ankyrin repeat protein